MNTLNLVLGISIVLLSMNASADSWTVTQGTTIGSNTDVTQKNTSSNSVQAVNSINLDGTNGTISSGSTQNLDISTHNLKLEQSNSTASSSQAVNRVYANTIDGIQQSITTGSNLSSILTLQQTNTVGSDNKQSINAAVTSDSGQIDALTQNISSSGQYINYQQQGGTSNVQAGSLIKSGNLSTTANAVTQSHTANYANFQQSGTTRSLQAGNAMLMIAGQSGGKLKQDFTSNVNSGHLIAYTQSSTTNSIQSMNYAGDEL